jgi:hypothetical protein
MVPVVQAGRQPAPKLVYLEVVTTALRKLGLSEESITRSIFRDLGDGSIPYDYTGEAPLPGFWRDLDNVRFNASDISNLMVCPASTGVMGLEWHTLRDVRLAWEAAVVKYPALRDIEPPDLGTSRVEVSFAAPLMRWVETLVARLRRRPPPSASASAFSQGTEKTVQTDPPTRLTRLQEMERAGFFKGAPALQEAADYPRATYFLGCVPDDVTPAQFARGLEDWLKARDKVKAAPDQWHTSNRFLEEFRRRS